MQAILVLLAFSTITTAQPVATKFCGGELIGRQGKIKAAYPSRIKKAGRKDNLNKTCLFYKSYPDIQNRPQYLKIIMKDVLVKEEPIQIKVKKEKGYPLETHNYFSHVYLSSTIITIRAEEYRIIKILVPKSLIQEVNMKFEEACDIKRLLSNEKYVLPEYCGAISEDVRAMDCGNALGGMACVFRCTEGHLPTYLSRDMYPVFVAQCHRESANYRFPYEAAFVENWSNKACVSEYEVAETCLDYTNCQFLYQALMIWFGILESRETADFRAYLADTDISDTLEVTEIDLEQVKLGTEGIRRRYEGTRSMEVSAGMDGESTRKSCRQRGFCHKNCPGLSNRASQLHCAMCKLNSQCRDTTGVGRK